MSTSREEKDAKDGGKREIKVTDRRMFTPDGELREEYKEAAEASGETASGGEAKSAAPPAAEPPPPREPPPTAAPGPPAADGGPEGARFEIPDAGAGPAPSFYDLIGILAEPASLYLQQAEQGGEDRAQNLEIARLHVELLDLLRKKTVGNVTAQESAALEDVLYRLRMGYVQVRG